MEIALLPYASHALSCLFSRLVPPLTGGRDAARGLAAQLYLALVNNCVEVVDVMQDGATSKACHPGFRF